MENETSKQHNPHTLGGYLRNLRSRSNYTLRQVEEATGISNAYLSQLENEKITKPSPHILHSLAAFYQVPYEDLMERAGYIKKTSETGKTNAKSGRLAASSLGVVSREEEDKLLEYLTFIRSRGAKKHAKG